MDTLWTAICVVYLLVTSAFFIAFLVVGFPYLRRWMRRVQERIVQWHRLEQQRAAERRRLEEERKAHLRFISDPANFPSLSESDRKESEQIVSPKVHSVARVSQVTCSAIGAASNGFIVELSKDFLPPDRVISRYTTRTTTTGRTVQGRKKKDSEFYDEYLNQHIAKQVLTRTRQIFQTHQLIQTVIFSGWTQLLDEYGNYKHSCILSVVVNRDLFERLNLTNLSPLDALRKFRLHLGQRYDSHLMPIEPLRMTHLQMAELPVDKPFAQLQTMNPYEFEKFVSHLLNKMGFQATATKPSQDGGVDVVAESDKPLMKGKIVVQCKRYQQPVGVTTVRELYGVMSHEGAMKGVIITTSDFTTEARKFAEGKPIELVDGALLQQLIKRHGMEKNALAT